MVYRLYLPNGSIISAGKLDDSTTWISPKELVTGLYFLHVMDHNGSSQIEKLQFTDQSSVDPHMWEWSFDDGAMSSDQHPVHMYDTAGSYFVCLAVSNDFASDTICQDIILTGTTSVVSASRKDQTPLISPYPFSTFIDFTPPEGRQIYQIHITDIQGHTIVNVEMSCPCRIVMERFPPGVYVYQLRLEDGEIISGKMVKL